MKIIFSGQFKFNFRLQEVLATDNLHFINFINQLVVYITPFLAYFLII